MFVLNKVLKMAPQVCRNKQPVARNTELLTVDNERMAAVMAE
jgi:hypothetical protein